MKYSLLYEVARSKAGILKEEWHEFEQGLERLSYKKAEFLVRPGESAENVFVVLSGIARNFVTGPNGREYTKVLRGPYDLLASYQEVLSGTEAKYFIQAITDLQAVKFSYRLSEAMMKKSHAWERLGRKIAEENFLEKERREFMLLHMTAEERYQEFLKDFKEFKDVIPQYQIANYLGISLEALHRQLKKG